MKTDKDWFKYFASDEVKEEIKKVSDTDEKFFRFLCEKIQLDARISALEEAAAIAWKEGDGVGYNDCGERAILPLADKLKEGTK